MTTSNKLDDAKSIATRFLAVLADDEQGVAAWHVAVRELGRQLHAATRMFASTGHTDPMWPLPEGLRWDTDELGQICIVGEPRTSMPLLGMVRLQGSFIPYGELCERDDADALTDMLQRRLEQEIRADTKGQNP